MKYPRIFAAAALAATATLSAGCATSIGDVGVQARLPGDVFEQARGVIAPRRLAPYQPRYTLSVVENANQSGFNGCGARATFIDHRSDSYVHLGRNSLATLLETGQAQYRWKTVRIEEFGSNERDAVRAVQNAYQQVDALARRNSRTLCLGNP
jgi:hypothetical protein